MRILPLPAPFEGFYTSNRSIVPHYAWMLETDNAQCVNVRYAASDEWGIECSVSPPFNQSVYHPTFNANISVKLDNYDGATTLDFTWAYLPIYFGSSIVSGLPIPIHSQVGDVGFDDSFPSVEFGNNDVTWDGAPKFSHRGSTSVVRGSDPTIGYIALQMNLTMTSVTIPDPGDVNYWVKDIEFNITTPLRSSTTTASSVPSSSSSSSTTIPVGVVVGTTLGAVAFVALLVIALLLCRRRRERVKGHMAHTISLTETVNHAGSFPHERESLIPLPWIVPDSTHAAQVGTVEPYDRITTPWIGEKVPSKASGGFLNNPDLAARLAHGTTDSPGSDSLPTEISLNTSRSVSIHPSSLFSRMPDDPPPTYGPEESVRQERTLPPLFSPELARFASANRDIINESLEARLQAAGYLPTDDPSNLTPEQWQNEYGVTRLELRRLQGLYTRSR